MSNYIIYCDTSCCSINNLCAWGCVIEYTSGKRLSYSGCYQNCCKPNIGELRAIIKAIGKVKSDRKARIKIFCDSKQLVEKISSMKKLKDAKKCGCEWVSLFNYKNSLHIEVEYINRNINPAHFIAKKELEKSRKSIELNSLDNPPDQS